MLFSKEFVGVVSDDGERIEWDFCRNVTSEIIVTSYYYFATVKYYHTELQNRQRQQVIGDMDSAIKTFHANSMIM